VALLSLSFQTKAQSLSFANLTGTMVSFGGGTFTFSSNNSGYQFDITAFDALTNSPSVGLEGYLTNVDSFTIGTITTNFNGSGTILESAPVFGSATLHITDASSNDLMGTIQWIGITTVGGSGASAGSLDLQGSVNFTNITYSGANSDLNALALAGAASDVITFQFTPGKTVDQLVAAGGTSSYSGVITAVPEPSTWVLVAIGIGSGVFLRGRRQVRR
jgi:hypothetical protein